MSNLTYSKEAIQHQLESLPSRSCVAFGLSCCERMLPNYVVCKGRINWGDDQPLREALDELWKYVEGEDIPKLAAKQMYDACEAVAPNSDDFSELLTTSAQDACFSTCCVLEYFLHGNPERIAQASSYSVDTVDLYISALLDGFSKTPKVIFNNAEHEEQIRVHPLMQRELTRQNADLELLASNPDLKTLKSRWRAPKKSNLDIGSK